MMKNETTVTKLTAAQTYALQAKADKRARVLEERANPELKADRQRVDAMFTVVEKVTQRKVAKVGKASKKVRWTGPELDLAIEVYLQFTGYGNVAVNNLEAVAKFQERFDKRNYGAVNMLFTQIRGLDTQAPQEGLKDTSQALIDKLYAADPVRFPGGANAEVKVMNALDLLLAELR